METKNKVLAMLLAGGQGSRLKAMTKDTAKPAVPFGGKYRIIDFALSNVANSGIREIAILTQYKPYKLNEHIGIGIPWDLNRFSGGLRILSPYASEEGGRWFTGTANAIFENMDYIDEVNPSHVLILSGDHIYKMNYQKMIEYHMEHDADCTISVIEVPWEEASRFGIVNVDDSMKIFEFDEKPEKPKNNMASMGIYVFRWEVLREYLIRDDISPASSHDFGKDILPLMLEEGNTMMAWKFKGYWKDVGTIKSYWESNLDLLDSEDSLNLFDRDWRIYTHNRNLPPHKIQENGEVKNSMVNEGCIIGGKVEHSILFSNVCVKEDAIIKNSVIHSNAIVGKGAIVENAIIMEDMVIKEHEKIGGDDDHVYLLSPDGIVIG
ncbi:MAG: glucose-1-phosphate adenylyltransferase [Tissierellia bacterium]|nr:glucose-1-phosphate adenylyltransferase [Tissierellia bacterium]